MMHKILGIAGSSGAGKTTLAEKLLPALQLGGFQPAYIKHSAHQHFLDKKGKDTARLFEAGAAFTWIGSDASSLLHTAGPFDLSRLPTSLSYDLILLEGFQEWQGPKIHCLKPEQAIPSFKKPPLAVQFATEQEIPKDFPYPSFHWKTAVQKILPTLLQSLKEYYQKAQPTKAALLAGGLSSRMGTEKINLDYGRGPQHSVMEEYLFQIFRPEDCFLSKRCEQDFPSSLPTIEDQFLGFGPLGGILSLFQKVPNASWLVLASDFACIDKETIQTLLQNRNPLKPATILQTDRLEPLAAIYEPSIQPWLQAALFEQNFGLTQILSKLPLEVISLPQENWGKLLNINTPEDAEKAKSYFKGT